MRSRRRLLPPAGGVVSETRAGCVSKGMSVLDASPGGRLSASNRPAFVLPAAGDLDLKRRIRALERDLFREALRRAGGKKSDAARLLGIDASNWAYHAKRLKLQ